MDCAFIHAITGVINSLREQLVDRNYGLTANIIRVISSNYKEGSVKIIKALRIPYKDFPPP